MSRLNNAVDRIIFYFLSLSLAALVVICFLQVVFRYVLNSSFSWAEEVSIILMVWATWGATCLAVKRGSHLQILFLVDRVSPKAKGVIRILTNALAIAFLVYVAYTSKIIITGMATMTLLSLPSVPINVLYFSVPVGCLLLIYYLSRLIVSDLIEFISQTPEGA